MKFNRVAAFATGVAVTVFVGVAGIHLANVITGIPSARYLVEHCTQEVAGYQIIREEAQRDYEQRIAPIRADLIKLRSEADALRTLIEDTRGSLSMVIEVSPHQGGNIVLWTNRSGDVSLFPESSSIGELNWIERVIRHGDPDYSKKKDEFLFQFKK